MNHFEREWQALHQSFLRYETLTQGVKALALIMVAVAWLSHISLILALFSLAVLWFHEGMLRQVQSRIYRRLVDIEREANAGNDLTTFHYLVFDTDRPGGLALIMGYLKSCLKPTVAVSYVAFFFLTLLSGVV